MLLFLLALLLCSPAMFFRRRGTGGFVPPPAVTARYWVGGTGTWDQVTTTHWSTTTGGAGGASVPTQYNDVIFDGNSGGGTTTVSASAPCNSITSSGSTVTLKHNASVTISIGSNSTTGPGGAALDFTGLTAYSPQAGGSCVLAFVSTVGTQQTVNYGTKTLSSQTFNGSGGSWKLASAMTDFGTVATLTLTAGALDTGNFAVGMSTYAITGSGTRSLTLGTSTVTVSRAVAAAWDCTTTTGLTFSGASSTINVTGAGGAGLQLFRGGGLTYGTVNITGTGTVIVTGSNTYTTFTRSNAAACGLRFIHGTTQTIPTAAGFTISGTSGNVVTVDTDLAGSAATISIASGTVNANFLSLKDSAATGGATFHAGAGSTNVSGNSGWIFP